MNKNYRFLSSFWIKLVALLAMILDHIGLMLAAFFLSNNHPLVEVFRMIGRISLPLYCFLIYQGVMHTKSFGKYSFRLGLMASLISIFLIAIKYQPWFPSFGVENFGNIFIDLLLGATSIYCLKNKNKKIKLLSILPILFSILSFIVIAIENNNNMIIHWFPFFIRPQYSFYGVLLIFSLYIGHLIKEWILDSYAQKTLIEKECIYGTNLDYNLDNLISCLIIITISVIYYMFYETYNIGVLSFQWMSLFSGVFILFYNYRVGYNKKWFQYGNYLYYPLHIGIIYLIFMLLTL